jgi:23S rRNA (adenine1618-N6)-methyltransferase
MSAGVLLPAVRAGEAFTFTMCNPPFFESMEAAGQNPATAFSGTAEEMTCAGGEMAALLNTILHARTLRGITWTTIQATEGVETASGKPLYLHKLHASESTHGIHVLPWLRQLPWRR